MPLLIDGWLHLLPSEEGNRGAPFRRSLEILDYTITPTLMALFSSLSSSLVKG